MKKIKIKLNKSEIERLLAVFTNYDINWIQNPNARVMVSYLLGKRQKKLYNLTYNATVKTERNVTLTMPEAAAFDEAFNSVYINHQVGNYLFSIYESTLINKILTVIGQEL